MAASSQAGTGKTASTTTGKTTGETVTVDLERDRARAGRARLASLFDATAGHTVWLVAPDETAAAYYGAPDRAGALVGGITRRAGGGWFVTAYADREHQFNSAGPVWYLPNATSRSHAARMLLRWWWLVACWAADGMDVRRLDPVSYPGGADRRFLFG
jgi:hypothetical protein